MDLLYFSPRRIRALIEASTRPFVFYSFTLIRKRNDRTVRATDRRHRDRRVGLTKKLVVKDRDRKETRLPGRYCRVIGDGKRFEPNRRIRSTNSGQRFPSVVADLF